MLPFVGLRHTLAVHARLVEMAWLAEQLAFINLGHESGHGEVRARPVSDAVALRLGIDVVEVQVVVRATLDADAAEVFSTKGDALNVSPPLVSAAVRVVLFSVYLRHGAGVGFEPTIFDL